MFPVFICEDDPKQRKLVEETVSSYITQKNYAMEVVLSTGIPTKVLSYLKENPGKNGIYILDVGLEHSINGVILAEEIRKQDIQGKIIFVTAYVELAFLAFQHRIEVMDYIVKNSSEEVTKKLKECLEIAYKRLLDSFLKREFFPVKTGHGVENILLEDIMFFESSHMPHKVVLHTANNRIEFYGSLSDIAKSSTSFYRCHQSYVINVRNIKSINKIKREVEMINGNNAIFTARKLKELQQMVLR